MAIKKYKPTTPSLRFRTGYTFTEITTDRPEKSLLKPLKKSGGRNNMGRITCRHRGGGHRRHYRIIDFKRDKFGVPAKVPASNMIPTVPPASPCCTIWMAKSAISSLPTA